MPPITPQLLIVIAALVLLAVAVGAFSARLFTAATRARVGGSDKQAPERR